MAGLRVPDPRCFVAGCLNAPRNTRPKDICQQHYDLSRVYGILKDGTAQKFCSHCNKWLLTTSFAKSTTSGALHSPTASFSGHCAPCCEKENRIRAEKRRATGAAMTGVGAAGAAAPQPHGNSTTTVAPALSHLDEGVEERKHDPPLEWPDYDYYASGGDEEWGLVSSEVLAAPLSAASAHSPATLEDVERHAGAPSAEQHGSVDCIAHTTLLSGAAAGAAPATRSFAQHHVARRAVFVYVQYNGSRPAVRKLILPRLDLYESAYELLKTGIAFYKSNNSEHLGLVSCEHIAELPNGGTRIELPAQLGVEDWPSLYPTPETVITAWARWVPDEQLPDTLQPTRMVEHFDEGHVTFIGLSSGVTQRSLKRIITRLKHAVSEAMDSCGPVQHTQAAIRLSEQMSMLMYADSLHPAVQHELVFFALTMLCISVRLSFVWAVNLLQDDSGHTLLSLAVLARKYQLVECLLQCGADAFQCTQEGTPFELARSDALNDPHMAALFDQVASNPMGPGRYDLPTDPSFRHNAAFHVLQAMRWGITTSASSASSNGTVTQTAPPLSTAGGKTGHLLSGFETVVSFPFDHNDVPRPPHAPSYGAVDQEMLSNVTDPKPAKEAPLSWMHQTAFGVPLPVWLGVFVLVAGYCAVEALIWQHNLRATNPTRIDRARVSLHAFYSLLYAIMLVACITSSFFLHTSHVTKARRWRGLCLLTVLQCAIRAGFYGISFFTPTKACQAFDGKVYAFFGAAGMALAQAVYFKFVFIVRSELIAPVEAVNHVAGPRRVTASSVARQPLLLPSSKQKLADVMRSEYLLWLASAGVVLLLMCCSIILPVGDYMSGTFVQLALAVALASLHEPFHCLYAQISGGGDALLPEFRRHWRLLCACFLMMTFAMIARLGTDFLGIFLQPSGETQCVTDLITLEFNFVVQPAAEISGFIMPLMIVAHAMSRNPSKVLWQWVLTCSCVAFVVCCLGLWVGDVYRYSSTSDRPSWTAGASWQLSTALCVAQMCGDASTVLVSIALFTAKSICDVLSNAFRGIWRATSESRALLRRLHGLAPIAVVFMAALHVSSHAVAFSFAQQDFNITSLANTPLASGSSSSHCNATVGVNMTSPDIYLCEFAFWWSWPAKSGFVMFTCLAISAVTGFLYKWHRCMPIVHRGTIVFFVVAFAMHGQDRVMGYYPVNGLVMTLVSLLFVAVLELYCSWFPTRRVQAVLQMSSLHAAGGTLCAVFTFNSPQAWNQTQVGHLVHVRDQADDCPHFSAVLSESTAVDGGNLELHALVQCGSSPWLERLRSGDKIVLSVQGPFECDLVPRVVAAVGRSERSCAIRILSTGVGAVGICAFLDSYLKSIVAEDDNWIPLVSSITWIAQMHGAEYPRRIMNKLLSAFAWLQRRNARASCRFELGLWHADVEQQQLQAWSDQLDKASHGQARVFSIAQQLHESLDVAAVLSSHLSLNRFAAGVGVFCGAEDTAEAIHELWLLKARPDHRIITQML